MNRCRAEVTRHDRTVVGQVEQHIPLDIISNSRLVGRPNEHIKTSIPDTTDKRPIVVRLRPIGSRNNYTNANKLNGSGSSERLASKLLLDGR